MSQIIPIYIPTYISNQTYAPARVLPRLFFYNGQVACEPFYLKNESNAASPVSAFPYFDNYNVVTGSFPTDGSRSLLFNNEAAVYGATPTSSLYSEYWDNYVSLLYNPKTRLLNCAAIIPLADYVKMELNDIVNFRGNYYHLRAINDYSLKDGTCQLQLLGPIIPDTFSNLQPVPPPTPPDSASISWTYSESSQNGSFRIYDNGSNKVTATSTSNGSLFVTQSHIVNAELDPVGFPSSGSVTMSLFVNGDTTISTTSNANTTITASFTAVGGNSYQITGSIQWNPASASCCTPTITSVTASGGNTIDVYFTTGSGCSGCTNTTIQSSTDNVNWGNNNTAGCGSPRTITAPTSSTYYRMYETCTSETSSFSNSVLFTTSSAATADLDWSFSVTGTSSGTMDIYVNGSNVESRNATSNGVWTGLVEGDEIYVEIIVSGCTGGSGKANAYCSGILTDAACDDSFVDLVTIIYTVQPGDIGTTLTLDCFASCDSACV